MAQILRGLHIKEEIKVSLREKIQQRLDAGLSRPTLAIVQIGNIPSSDVYIRMKKAFAESIGAEVFHVRLFEETKERELVEKITELNNDPSINGIIVQLPLPNHLNQHTVIEAIDPKKDADGMHSKNKNSIVPATTRGILTLLDYYKITLAGKDILVIGRSDLVGIPTALALLARDATVTVAHLKTKNLKEKIQQAEIVVVAAGHPGLIAEDMVNKNQVIVDVGITSTSEGIRGDVEFLGVSKIVTSLSPVPGGVGPLTVSSLFQNLLDIM